MTYKYTREHYLHGLKEVAKLDNRDGNDSTKRAAAIEALAGPADGKQTDRLLALAIAFVEAQGPVS